jgi:acetolactate decarboxylase
MNPSNEKILFITAPVNALVEGLYQEDTSMAQILERGDFGLGTFNDLDGEMVVLDGKVYQLRADGQAYEVPPQTKSPFACVTFFKPYSFEDVSEALNYQALIALLDRTLPSKNMLYAIKIEGKFSHVKTRSVPKQEAYKPLVEVAREQSEFTFENIEGCMVGFWTPGFLSSIAVPGYHLHFLTDDKAHGGQLLECSSSNIKISIQHVARVELGLPITLDFLTADLSRDITQDLNEAEH